MRPAKFNGLHDRNFQRHPSTTVLLLVKGCTARGEFPSHTSLFPASFLSASFESTIETVRAKKITSGEYSIQYCFIRLRPSPTHRQHRQQPNHVSHFRSNDSEVFGICRSITPTDQVLIFLCLYQTPPSTANMGISRDSRHKRSATGAKRAFYRKKRYGIPVN